MTLAEIIAPFKAEFPLAILGEEENGKYILLKVEIAKLPQMAEFLKTRLNLPFTMLFGNDERPLSKEFGIYYLFDCPEANGHLLLRVSVPEGDLSFPSISPVIPHATWYEREVRDMLGLEPVGHPDPRRLVLHEDWPEGFYPLRKEFELKSQVPRVEGKFNFQEVEGEGIFEIPVGPVHAGVIEPGHFRFSSIGETVFNLEVRLFYKHRGIEKMAENRPADQVVFLAERISGTSSMAHSTAFCQGMERIAGTPAPRKAQYIRVLLLELERLYNHVGDIGGIATDVAFIYPASLANKLREDLLRLNELVTGSRYLMGMNRIGGVRRDISPEKGELIRKKLAEFKKEFDELMAILKGSGSFLDRVEKAGELTHQVAMDLGAVGPVARASGVDRDVRRDFPYAAYPELEFNIITGRMGDVLARMDVKAAEIHESLKLIAQVLSRLPEGEIAQDIAAIPPHQWVLSAVETPRGEALHWIMTGPENSLYRYKIRTPSYVNWPILPHAFEGNIVPDFPLCNKSFNLSYSGTDL